MSDAIELPVVKDPFPVIGKRYFWSTLIDKVQNSSDAKAVTAWLGLIGATLAGLYGIITTIYELINFSAVVDFFAGGSTEAIVLLASSLTLLFVIAVILRSKIKQNRTLRSYDTASDFEILQVVFACHIKANGPFRYTDRYWVKANRDGCRFFDANFTWSGKIDELSILVSGDAKLHEITETSKIGQRKLTLDLGQDFSIGHEAIFDIVQSISEDPGKVSCPLPFISVAMLSNKFPKYNTFLGVILEEGLVLKSLNREWYFPILADRAVKRTPVKLETDNSHFWPVRQKIGSKSLLRWSV